MVSTLLIDRLLQLFARRLVLFHFEERRIKPNDKTHREIIPFEVDEVAVKTCQIGRGSNQLRTAARGRTSAAARPVNPQTRGTETRRKQKPNV